MELLCLDIINSNRFGEYLAKPGRDMLNNANWLHVLVDKWNLDVKFPIQSNDLKILQELRDNMQQAVKYLNLDTKLCAEELVKVNSILKNTPLCDSWANVIWSTAYSFAKLISEYDITRIKICENKDCGWIFYDESKSRTRRWCDHKICGNLMKVRRYRERQKQTEQ